MGERHDQGEAGWEAERRSFVADVRDDAADRRDQIGDERDQLADERDRTADQREGRLDGREQRLDTRDGAQSVRVMDRTGERAAAGDRRLADADLRRDAATARSDAALVRERHLQRRGPADRLLAREFAHLAVTLYTADTLEKILDRVVHVAAEAIPGCDRASVTLLDGGRPWTPAATDEDAAAFDEFQYRLGEGPCLDALRNPIVAAHGDSWNRWPKVRDSKPESVESVVSCGFLFPTDQPSGALNLYGSAPDVMDDQSQQIALILAAHAAVAVATARERHASTELEHGLRDALVTRDVIGQAKGVLMARQRISADDAFDVM